MNKKGLSLIRVVILLLILSMIGYIYWDYYLEKDGSNEDMAEFCRNLGYEVENEVSFFKGMTCIKIEDRIKTAYWVEESKTNVGEYYLRRASW